jgi:hypothetical protein
MNQLVGDDALVRIEGITGATNIRRQIGVGTKPLARRTLRVRRARSVG